MKQDPAPRILFQDVPEDLVTKFDHAFEHLPGTHRVKKGLMDFVHESDYDLLVTWAPEPELPSSWHVLSFGYSGRTLSLGPRILDRTSQWARHNYVADPKRSDADLVERTIVAQYPEPSRRTWYAGEVIRRGIVAERKEETGDLGGLVTPLVHVGEEQYVSAFVADRGNGRLMWVLPAGTTEPIDWVTQVLRELHLIDPKKFPGNPDWMAGDGWAPPLLLAARDALLQQREERDRVVADAQAKVDLAEQRVEEVRAQSAAGPWRLLTADGDDLVAAVTETLTIFGFKVEDRDKVLDEETGSKLEDLLVTDPHEQMLWESLVEVKGYTKGARANDVSKITGRPWGYFLKRKGREPAAVWHVVNAWRQNDPDNRSKALNDDTDLQRLTEVSGALIDTRDLFRAWRAVVTGETPADEVRRSLRTARTRWTFPPTSP